MSVDIISIYTFCEICFSHIMITKCKMLYTKKLSNICQTYKKLSRLRVVKKNHECLQFNNTKQLILNNNSKKYVLSNLNRLNKEYGFNIQNIE